MEIIKDIYGKAYKISCIACDIWSGKIKSTGTVAQTKNFMAEQDTEIPIPGFIIVSSKRHVVSIDEFKESELKEFILLVSKVRKAMRKALGVKFTYLFENEDTAHSHFHLWMFPRYPWMKKFGNRIQSVRPIMEYAREKSKTKKNLKQVESAVKKLRLLLSTSARRKRDGSQE